MRKFHCRRLALLALAVTPCLAQAQQAAPAFARASITDLKYELIDLAPNDGQEAWVMFAGPALAYGVDTPAGYVYKGTGSSPLVVINNSVTAGFDNYAHVAPDRFATSASLSPAQLPPSATLTDPSTYTLDRRSASIFRHTSMDAEPGETGAITLGPHSKIIIEGKAVGTVFASAQAGVATVDRGAVPVPYTLTSASAATVRFGFLPDFFSQSIVNGLDERVQVSDVFDSRNAAHAGAGLSKSFDKPLLLMLENTSDTDIYAIWEVGIHSSVSTTFATTPVPEPSVLALGLGGMLVAGMNMKRRRRGIEPFAHAG